MFTEELGTQPGIAATRKQRRPNRTAGIIVFPIKRIQTCPLPPEAGSADLLS
jgi:hypothetical protein